MHTSSSKVLPIQFTKCNSLVLSHHKLLKSKNISQVFEAIIYMKNSITKMSLRLWYEVLSEVLYLHGVFTAKPEKNVLG